jgi:regulator of replication initiation timing
MADFRSSAMIERPVHEVFDYMTDFEKNASELLPNVVKVEKITEGPVGEGTKFLETRNIRGKEATSEIEVIKFERNKAYSVKSESNGLVVIYHYVFHEIEEGTQVEFEAEIQTTGLFMKLTKPMLVKMIKQEDGDQLKYLKEEMEKANKKESNR